MKKYQIILLILIVCSFLFSGCSKKSDQNVKIVDKTITKEELPSCIRLGTYKGVKVSKPEVKAVTDADIKQQTDYAVKNAGESTLTEKNVKAISGYHTIAEYKKAIKASLEKQNQLSMENELMNKAWDAAVDQATLIKCSKADLDEQIAEVKAGYESYTQTLGMSYNEVLKYFGVTKQDIRAKAINFIKSDTLVYAIAKAENITVSDTEYQQEVQKRMKFFQVSTEQELADKLGAGSDLHFVFLADKVMQFVYQKAKIETKTT